MGSIYLRSLETSDLERTFKWHNDPDLYRQLGGTFHYVSHATEEDWLRRKQGFSNNELNLAICTSEEHRHIGNIYLRNIDWVVRHCEMQIFIGEAGQRGKGYGVEALTLLIRHAFLDLGMQRMYLYVLEDNQPAIKLYQRCGFVREGVLRRHAFKDGQFKNYIVMGLCAGLDWNPAE